MQYLRDRIVYTSSAVELWMKQIIDPLPVIDPTLTMHQGSTVTLSYMISVRGSQVRWQEAVPICADKQQPQATCTTESYTVLFIRPDSRPIVSDLESFRQPPSTYLQPGPIRQRNPVSVSCVLQPWTSTTRACLYLVQAKHESSLYLA